jgi:hypothetical protein
MSATKPATSNDMSQAAVDRETFLAVVVTHERSGVLRELTHQAVEHFRHDQLHIRQVSVVAADAGATFIATATFSSFSPDA